MRAKKILSPPVVVGILIILLVTLMLVKFRGNHGLSSWVLVYSTIALAFITWLYALQTKKLVEEEQIKRKAEFWEKRISEFYMPFIDNLNKIRESVAINDVEGLYGLHNELVKLVWGKRYMVSSETADKIKEFFPFILMARDGNKLINKYQDNEENLRKLRSCQLLFATSGPS